MNARLAHLRQLLNQHQPADEIEAAHHRRMVELLGAAGDPLARDHFQPGHFTASAFVLSPDGESLLLILHGKLHRWLQPGGHVEPGDPNIVAAAQREATEEVGLTDLTLLHPGVFDADVHPIPALKGEPAHEHFDVRFLFQASTREFAVGDEVNGAKWVRLDQLTEQMADASVMRAVRRVQRLAAS